MKEETLDRIFAVAADETGKIPSNLAGIPMPSGLKNQATVRARCKEEDEQDWKQKKRKLV